MLDRVFSAIDYIARLLQKLKVIVYLYIKLIFHTNYASIGTVSIESLIGALLDIFSNYAYFSIITESIY